MFSNLPSSQLYSFDTVAEKSELPGGFTIGAGAGSSFFSHVNCEVIMPSFLLLTFEINPASLKYQYSM